MSSCTTEKSRVIVNHIGDRGKIFSGDLSGKLKIKELQKINKTLYGLGPVAQLNGEITVIGKPYVSFIEKEEEIIRQDWDTEAIFFVYSYVDKWKEIILNESFKDRGALEARLEPMLQAENYNSKNIPLMIIGRAESLTYHLMNKINNQPHSKLEHQKAKYMINLENQTARFLAFYSAENDPSFTHGKFHIHLVSDDEAHSGHLDSFRELEVQKVLLPE